MSHPAVAPIRISPWAPLRTPMFRAFWIASLASNMGTWIHEVGAGWLMTGLDPSPQMVAAVRTAMSLPIVFLAIPAGALADRMDRRRLLLATQLGLFSITMLLASLTRLNLVSAWGLLALTFLIGLGMVLHIPTWQASVPELVPRDQLSRAVALGSISFNLARALGPALGGILIAWHGVWITFAVNALSFAGVIGVLIAWNRRPTESTRGMSFGASLRHGMRFVSRLPTMRHVLTGVFLFVVPASVMWSLLPLIVSEQLGWQAGGFGLLYTAVGVGAVAAAYVLPRVERRFGRDMTIALSMTAFALGILLLTQVRQMASVVPVMMALGGAWMMTLTTLNTTAQMCLPKRMRARGMGCYLAMMALSMSVGSLTWGFIAQHTSLSTALVVASITMFVAAIVSLRFQVGTAS